MTKTFLRKQINRWIFWLLLGGLVGVRLLVAFSQRVFLLPEGSGLDDALMVRAAQSITAGDWLGEYGGAAIAKNMGFSVWLAFLHALRFPLLPANALLWILGSGFAVWCLRPVFCGRLSQLVLFSFLAFQPVSFAAFTMRAYRDAIFPAFCLLFFAGMVGLGLRLNSSYLRGMLFSSLGAGIGLAGAWLMREDGPVLLPFGICGWLLLLLFLLFGKTAARPVVKALVCLVPFGVLFLGVLGFSAANQAGYGVFMVNDMTSGSFPKAYGALVAVSQAESEWQPAVPVTQQALEKMYREIPSLEKLKPSLTEGAAYNGFSSRETGEFGGSFYFAVRLAAGYEGLTPNAVVAQRFWEQMLLETQQAVGEGRLKSLKPKSSTIPRWDSRLLWPTLVETGAGAVKLLTFQDCDPRPAESIGPEEKINQMAAYLHSPVQQGYVAGTDILYYNAIQKLCFGLCDLLVWVYRIVIWPLLGFGIWSTLRGCVVGCRTLFRNKRFDPQFLCSLLALGLLLSGLLRLVVAAYMEVAAFGIGTYLMYLSGGMPPLLLFVALAAGLAGFEGKTIREDA